MWSSTAESSNPLWFCLHHLNQLLLPKISLLRSWLQTTPKSADKSITNGDRRTIEGLGPGFWISGHRQKREEDKSLQWTIRQIYPSKIHLCCSSKPDELFLWRSRSHFIPQTALVLSLSSTCCCFHSTCSLYLTPDATYLCSWCLSSSFEVLSRLLGLEISPSNSCQTSNQP